MLLWGAAVIQYFNLFSAMPTSAACAVRPGRPRTAPRRPRLFRRGWTDSSTIGPNDAFRVWIPHRLGHAGPTPPSAFRASPTRFSMWPPSPPSASGRGVAYPSPDHDALDAIGDGLMYPRSTATSEATRPWSRTTTVDAGSGVAGHALVRAAQQRERLERLSAGHLLARRRTAAGWAASP